MANTRTRPQYSLNVAKTAMSFTEITLSDLEFFERLCMGARGAIYRGRWKSKDRTVAIKKLRLLKKEEVNHTQLSSDLLAIKGNRAALLFVPCRSS